jgi:hypothetical protein
MKLVTLIKMCLNETHSKMYMGKHMSESFLIQNGLKQGDALSPGKPGWTEIEWNISTSGLC